MLPPPPRGLAGAPCSSCDCRQSDPRSSTSLHRLPKPRSPRWQSTEPFFFRPPSLGPNPMVERPSSSTRRSEISRRCRRARKRCLPQWKPCHRRQPRSTRWRPPQRGSLPVRNKTGLCQLWLEEPFSTGCSYRDPPVIPGSFHCFP